MIADLEYLKLSLRKDRKVLVGVAAAFAVTLALSSLWGPSGLQENLAFWIFLGLPVIGALIGGSSGAEARTDAEVESALPLSPGRRTLGRLATGVLALALVTAVLWAAALVLPSSGSVKPMSPDSIFVRFALYAAYGSLTAFAIGYACDSSAIGATGGLLVMVLLTGAIGPLVVMERLYPGRGPFASTLWGVLGGGLAAAAVSVALTARRRVWRRVSDSEHAALQAVVAAALVVSILVLSDRYAARFWRGLELYSGFIGTLTTAPAGSRWPVEVRLRAPEGGVYANALDGRLVWLTKEGRLVEAAPPRRDRGVLKALADVPNAGGGELFYSSDGLVWLLRRDSAGGSEIWRGKPGEPMGLLWTLPDGTWADALVETPTGMSVLTSYPKRKLAALAPARPLEWKELAWPGTWSWRYVTGAALPDGTAANVWQDRMSHRRGEGVVKVRGLDGTLVNRGVVRIPDGYTWPFLVRLDERHGWYVEGYWLTERDLRGRLLGSWRLPEWTWDRGDWPHVTTPVRAAAEGLYVRTPGRVTLVDWEGRVRGRFKL